MAIRKQRTEMLVGLFVFFGLLVMGFLILQFGRISERIRDNYLLVVDVPDATGIRKGVPVRLGGASLGYVSAPPTLKPDFSGLRLEVRIFEGMKIPRGSQFSVATSGMMGDTYISVALPEVSTGEFYQAGEEISGVSTTNIDSIPEKADILISEVSTAVADIGRGVDLLEKAFGNVNEGLLNEGNVEDIKVILTQLRKSSENVGDASTQLEPLLKDAGAFFRDGRKVVEGIDSTLEDATVTLGAFQTALEEAGPAVAKLDPTLEELQATLENLNRTIYKIEHGNGLASALINDTDLRKDLEDFVEKLEKNGILGYPKDRKSGGLFQQSQNQSQNATSGSTRSSSGAGTAKPEKKGKNPFSWLKPKQ